MTYTIGEVAKQLDITASALRYYDKEGLLPFVERTDGGLRIFKDSDFSWLSVIECLKKTGMPIKDIKKFVDMCIAGDETINQRLELITDRQTILKNQIAEMEENLEILNFKRWFYETAKEMGTCPILEEMPLEDIPKEFHKYVLHPVNV